MIDATLYDLPTKTGLLERLPSGRFALDDDPLVIGDVIEIASTCRGRWMRVTVMHDTHGWYGFYRRPGERVHHYALVPGLKARRVGAL